MGNFLALTAQNLRNASAQGLRGARQASRLPSRRRFVRDSVLDRALGSGECLQAFVNQQTNCDLAMASAGRLSVARHRDTDRQNHWSL